MRSYVGNPPQDYGKLKQEIPQKTGDEGDLMNKTKPH
jgi:hypothetical protein